MAVNLSPVGGAAAQFFDNSGNVLTGGKIYTYLAGTTTPAATYTSAAGITAWSNPIVLDAAGRVSGSGEIWLTDGISYKFVLKDSNDVLIATYDNLIGINSNFVSFAGETEIQTATAGQTVFTLTTMQYTPGTNNLTVFVDGVNQYEGSTYSYTETNATTVTFDSGLHVGALVKFTTAQLLSSGTTDASLVTYKYPDSNSVATNVETKLSESVSVLDFGADNTGVVDCSSAVNNALAATSVIRFTKGSYLIESDIVMNTGNYIIVDSDAIITCDGARVTSYRQSNITLEVHGEISSINMATAAARSGWPSDTGGVPPTTTNQRAFIEFGGISSELESNFKVFGTGVIHGDWVGTPNITNLWTGDLNFKGIAAWYANNVNISGIEVYGFRGEAVYYYTSVAANNIVFDSLYVHDTQFNGINFNSTAELTNAVMNNCYVDTAYQCAELSAGVLQNCTLTGSVGPTVQFGGGVVQYVQILNNYIEGSQEAGINTINAVGNSGAQNVVISGNFIRNTAQNAIYGAALNYLEVKNNTVTGYAQNLSASTTGVLEGYGVFIRSTVLYANVCENFFNQPEAGYGGCIRSNAITSVVENNQTQSTADNSIIALSTGPIPNLGANVVDYKVMDGLGAANVGFYTNYANGLAESLSNGDSFASAGAVAVGAIAGQGTKGQYIINTYKNAYTDSPGYSFIVDHTGASYPGQDNNFSTGAASRRWSVVYAGTGTINTSDAAEKQQVRTLEEKEIAVAKQCKSLIRAYKFNDSVASKGNNARIHFGVLAQDVKAAFEAESLDATKYGLFCSDAWYELDGEWVQENPDGTYPEGAVEVTRLGIRYDELLAFIIAGL